MNPGEKITDRTSGAMYASAPLRDGTLLVIEQADLDPTALVAGLRVTPLPENDVVVVGAFAPEVAAQVRRFAGLVVAQKQHSSQLIEAMFTASATVSSAAVRQALRNAEARQELIEEFGVLDSAQVARLAGSTAKNRSATASRWLAAGQVFAIDHRGARYYPAFQFDEHGRPYPVVAEVLAVLRVQGLDDWAIALWFTTASGWLDDRRPVDLFAEDPDGIVAAAGATFDSAAG